MEFSALNLPASLFALAVLIWLFQAMYSLWAGQKISHDFSSKVFFFPCVCLLLSACFGWSSDIYFFPAGYFSFGKELIVQHIDALSSLFLGLLALIGIAVSLFSPAYLEHLAARINGAHYWASLCVFMLSMSFVLVSANALSFMVFWELMSLSSLCLVASEHKLKRVQDSAYIYLGATRIASSFLLAGFLYMHSLSKSFNFSQWANLESQEILLPAALVLLGLAIKAGVWPFHIWLPYAHPAAPSPVSALMSGVMIKIAVYAMIRILILGNLCPLIIGQVCLVFGLISAFWGILFALVQHDLKRLLAYSSVENLGLILMALGLAIVANHSGFDDIACLALTAALFHVLNHGIYKSLLFLAAGTVDAQAHSRDLFHLGGLGSKMPYTMISFFLASASICALPPLSGFVSKVLIYQGLLQLAFKSDAVFERICALVAIGGMAMVGGLTLACFCKAAGITFLGLPRNKHMLDHLKEGTKGMLAAQAFLCVVCLGLALSASYLSVHLQSLAASILKVKVVNVAFYSLSAPVFAMSILFLFAAIYFVVLRSSKVKSQNTWDCGFGSLSARNQASSVSLAQPIAYIFGPLLRFKMLIEISGRDRRNFPEHIKVEPQMSSLLEQRIYLPTIAWIQNLSKYFAKLQAGSIHLYLLYVCATLLVLVLVGTRL